MSHVEPVREQPVDTVRLQDLVKGFWESATLMAAVELGLFTAIDSGADSIDKVAAALDIEPVNAERLMTACAALGLLERSGDSFRNPPDVDRFLVEGRPSYAGPWMLFSKPRWADWGKLSEHLRRKGKGKRLGMYVEFTIDDARRYHEATYSIGMGAARRFHRQVDLSGRRRIMDLGGGSGCYCIVAATRYPELSAVVLDLAPVVAVTRQFIADHGVGDRVTAEACDFTSDPLPDDCDVALMASNLPQYDEAIIQGVVRRVYDALLPGGEFHLIGEMLDDDRAGPVGPALWGLSEAISCSTCKAHARADCVAYLRNAGFEKVEVHDFIPRTLARVVGTKPG